MATISEHGKTVTASHAAFPELPSHNGLHSASGMPKQNFEPLNSVLLLTLLGLAMGLVVYGKIIADIWYYNSFNDTDDAMRLVEMRDFVLGQGWRDMHQYRLDPAMPVLMHWSRLLDPVMGALVSAFSLVFTQDYAERAMRIAYPLALYCLNFCVIFHTVRVLAGAKSLLPAFVFVVVTGPIAATFMPGHIDHHNVQTLLLLAMVGSGLFALDAGRRHASLYAALSGVWVSLTVAISVENILFVAMLVGAFGLAFIRDGARQQKLLRIFGFSYALSTFLLYVALMPSQGWYLDNFYPACDAFSASYVVVAGAVGTTFWLLGILPLKTAPTRFVASALMGTAVIAIIHAHSPRCFGDPLAGVDPLVQDIWLHNVQEAVSWPRLYAAKPLYALEILTPCLLGLMAALYLWRTALLRAEKARDGVASETARLEEMRFMLLALQLFIGCVGTFWQIRVCCSTCALAVIPCAILTGRLIVSSETSVTRTAKLLPVISILLFISPCLAGEVDAFFNLDADNKTPAAAHANRDAMAALNVLPTDPLDEKKRQCDFSANIAALNALKPGVVAASIDLGASILALTPHGVLAAPFHRDNHGNRAMMDMMLGDFDSTHRLITENHVTYVVICPTMFDEKIYAERAPQGFAARLAKGEVPDYLQKVVLEPQVLNVFEVKE